MVLVKIKNIPIQFSKRDILSYLGFKPRKTPGSPEMDVLLEEVTDLARLVISPVAVYDTFDVEHVGPENMTFLDTRFSLMGEKITAFMSSCSKVSLIAATVGAEIDSEIGRLFNEGDSTRAVMLDAVGSDAVEQVVDWVDKLIQREAQKQGCGTLHRVSPGYSLWSIEANRAIARIMEVEKIGIEVLPSFEMLPRKSVMAAVGWVGQEV